MSGDMVIRRRSGCTAQNAPCLLAVLLTLALLAAGCTSGGGALEAGEAATLTAGPADVSIDSGEWATRESGDTIPAGARVRASAVEVVMDLRGGTSRLAPGSMAVVGEDDIEILAGELLVETAGAISARWADTEVVADGVARLTGGLSARIAVYRGVATVQRPAQQRELAALRELDLSAFRLAGVSDPLRYSEADVWDQELVGDAIAFDGEAARVARGLDVEFGSAPRRPRFYREFAGRSLIPVLESAATKTRGRRFGPPSDVLLTVFIARAADASDALTQTVRTIAGLRSDGARWGLIAMEFDVGFTQLAAQIDDLQSTRLALADRTGSPESSAGSPGGGGDDSGDAAAGGGGTGDTTDSGTNSGSGGGGGNQSGDRNPPGGGGGDDSGDDEPPPSGEDPVDDVVNDVVTTLEDTTDDDEEQPQGNRLPQPDILPLPPLPLP